jgi:hypothetical protein
MSTDNVKLGGPGITVDTTLRRADLFWMNQDSWSARGGFLLGAVLLASSVAAPNHFTVAAYALVIIGFSVGVLPVYAMWLTGSFGLAGRTVRLYFDNVGVAGWPRGADDDRTWDRANRIWMRPGVIILQFGRTPGSRGGRIVVPVRDVSPQQRTDLHALLVAHGLSVAWS